jgi:retron-type reverse transcriptase
MDFASGSLRLKVLGLPVIRDLDDFALATHVSKYTIFRLSKYSELYYQSFEIPKKNGGCRLIAQPSRKLKAMQGWILRNILDKLRVSESCKGFERGSRTSDNAAPHVGANIVINLDLENFFPSVAAKRVYAVFRTVGYNRQISTVLSRLTTFREGLPQGGPCSPKLANLVAWKLDSRIQGYVGKKGIVYTRYADDLSFSGSHPNRVCKILPTVRQIIESEGFTLNQTKSRVAGVSRQKKITGLVLSENSFGIGRRQHRVLRAKIHRLSQPGEAHNADLFYHVKGWLAYLKSVDEKRFAQSNEYINMLLLKNDESVLRGLLPGGKYPLS